MKVVYFCVLIYDDSSRVSFYREVIIMNQKLNEFFKTLDRSYFISNKNKHVAHFNIALSIGYKQTISQPSLVLEMTQYLQLNKTCRVLEIGTGSGYQTAFLAEFSHMVYTIERIEPLSLQAQERLEKLGYHNITYIIGDGSQGCKQYAPYDRIMVTAAASDVPQELIDQLDVGGRMVIPVGDRYLQDLMLITKNKKLEIKQEVLLKVVFVEMKGKYGWKE